MRRRHVLVWQQRQKGTLTEVADKAVELELELMTLLGLALDSPSAQAQLHEVSTASRGAGIPSTRYCGTGLPVQALPD